MQPFDAKHLKYKFKIISVLQKRLNVKMNQNIYSYSLEITKNKCK